MKTAQQGSQCPDMRTPPGTILRCVTSGDEYLGASTRYRRVRGGASGHCRPAALFNESAPLPGTDLLQLNKVCSHIRVLAESIRANGRQRCHDGCVGALLSHLLGGAPRNPAAVAEPDDRQSDCSADSAPTHGLNIRRDLHEDVFLSGGQTSPNRTVPSHSRNWHGLKFARDDGLAASRSEWQNETIDLNLADFGR